MGKNPNYSLLPDVALLKMFQFSKLEDLYNLQQACPKFKQLIEDLKAKEIENDWRLNYLKYEKFGTEISATGAIKSLELAKKKKGGKYSLNGRFVRGDAIESIIDSQLCDSKPYKYLMSRGDAYHNIVIFTEVSKYFLIYELIFVKLRRPFGPSFHSNFIIRKCYSRKNS